MQHQSPNTLLLTCHVHSFCPVPTSLPPTSHPAPFPQALLEEMRSAQQVRLGLERQREELQRQLASLDSQLAITRARLEDAGSENASLSQRLALERNRVSELEALLAGMRAREYRNDLSTTKSGSQLAIMQERNRILEEQVCLGEGGELATGGLEGEQMAGRGITFYR